MKRYFILALIFTYSTSSLAQNAEAIVTKKKRTHSAAVTYDNAFGGTVGASYFYNLPHNPWMIGLKFRYIDNVTSNIVVTGHTISIEPQMYLWHRKRFQLWATSEIGIMQVNLDFSKINSLQKDIGETSYLISAGFEGRYNLTERLRLIAGAGVMYNDFQDSYKGNNQEYDLEINKIYLTGKIGLLYMF